MDKPDGYDEIGQSMAELVVNEAKPLSWVLDVGKMLGYKSAVVREWVDYYRQQYAEELLLQQRKQQRNQRLLNRRLTRASEKKRKAASLLDWG